MPPAPPEPDADRLPPPVPPWGACFKATGTDEAAVIDLRQIEANLFALRSSLTFVGRSDVRAPREVGPDTLPSTDLTSVPLPFRWFVSPYGLHTPAALLHDRLVGAEAPDFPRHLADRLFRHVLDCLGVPLVRRWLMWAAVAYGTRWSAGGYRRVLIVVWTLLALVGMAALLAGLVTWSPPLLLFAALLPFPAALLWGRQYGGGLLGAASGPWLGLPAIIVAVGYAVYWVIEKILQLLPIPHENRAPMSPKDF
jgi:hypothetical protein